MARSGKAPDSKSEVRRYQLLAGLATMLSAITLNQISNLLDISWGLWAGVAAVLIGLGLLMTSEPVRIKIWRELGGKHPMAVAILTGLIVGLFATGSAWFLIRQESVRAGVQRGTAVRKAKIQVITSRLTKDLEVTNSLEYQFRDHKGEWTWNDVKQFEKQINDIGVPLSDHLDRELPGSGASVLIRDVVGEVGKGPVHYEYSRLLALRASIRNVIERLEFYVDRSSINQGPNPGG